MPTPKPHFTAPPIPQTLDLDTHARHFFFETEWSAPVDARFKLDHPANPALSDKIFIGRVARFCSGALHLVMREFTGDAAVDAKAPVLMSALALPFNPKEPQVRAKLTRRHLAQSLDYPGDSGGRDWQSRVPTLRDSDLFAGFARLHFDAATGLGLKFREDICCLMDRREDTEGLRERDWVSEGIDLGEALFGWEAPTNARLSFMEMSDDAFHERVQELVGDDSFVLYHSVQFQLMDTGERVRHVFVCEWETHRAARWMLRLALVMELGAGGAFEGWAEARWHPWAEEELIESRGEGKRRVAADVPQSLRRWLDAIGEVTGCKVREEVREDVEGLHDFARSFARAYTVRADAPSAHEAMEAWARLKELTEESKS